MQHTQSAGGGRLFLMVPCLSWFVHFLGHDQVVRLALLLLLLILIPDDEAASADSSDPHADPQTI